MTIIRKAAAVIAVIAVIGILTAVQPGGRRGGPWVAAAQNAGGWTSHVA